jgi:protein-arginine deiminase
MSRKFETLLSCCLVAACGPGGGGGGDDEQGSGSNNPDGGMTTTPDAAELPIWSFRDVYGVPNIDDDDGATNDWPQAPFPADDDFSKLVLKGQALGVVPAGGKVELSLTGDLASIRVFKNGQHVLGAERGTMPHSFTPAGGDEELLIEFGNYLARADLTIVARSATNAMVQTATVKLQAAPLIINHHLQPAERLWAVSVSGNSGFISAYQTALGAKFTTVSGSSVGSDVWMQDEFEFATMTGDENQRIDVVIDSIRNRGLQSYSPTFVSPDSITRTWGNAAQATSYDSFGNLEASPPVNVGGVDYPFGKIFYGRIGTEGLNTTLGTYLTSQKVQAPFQLDTTWLCVGHVDEFSSFVPDPNSAKGFKLVISDVDAAYAMLDAMSPSASLPVYSADHGYATVGAITGDSALRALNLDLQATYLDPIVNQFKTQLGLTEADIIRLPSLFETVGGCGGGVAALIPGMVNLIVAKDGATTHLFTADPFFRAVQAQSADPIISSFTSLMPPGMQLHFIDNWDVYHMGLGEVHCGTNVRRTPTSTWWTTAGHLMGGP